MIAPDFRTTEALNFQDAYKIYIVQNHGILILSLILCF